MLRTVGRAVALGLRAPCRLAARPALRGFADAAESHSDFAPKTKVATDADLVASLTKIVKEHKVVLFMKGTPEQPMCGFSAKVVKLLHMNGAYLSGKPLVQTRSPPDDDPRR